MTSTTPLEVRKDQSTITEVPAPETAPKDTLKEDLLRQYKEELGPDTVPIEHDLMLRQKFGIIPVQPEFTGGKFAREVKMMEAANGGN